MGTFADSYLNACVTFTTLGTPNPADNGATRIGQVSTKIRCRAGEHSEMIRLKDGSFQTVLVTLTQIHFSVGISAQDEVLYKGKTLRVLTADASLRPDGTDGWQTVKAG
jgi:hypothetical protein